MAWEVESLVNFFPLCMRNLFYVLKVERNLKYKGRLQLGLFLKAIGLSLDEALSFWKSMFSPNTPNDKFDREYSYSFRHIYGREGNHKSYNSYDCSKIIMQSQDSQKKCGCPFRFWNKQQLKVQLQNLKI